jgi:hypothetical protein
MVCGKDECNGWERKARNIGHLCVRNAKMNRGYRECAVRWAQSKWVAFRRQKDSEQTTTRVAGKLLIVRVVVRERERPSKKKRSFILATKLVYRVWSK